MKIIALSSHSTVFGSAEFWAKKYKNVHTFVTKTQNFEIFNLNATQNCIDIAS